MLIITETGSRAYECSLYYSIYLYTFETFYNKKQKQQQQQQKYLKSSCSQEI